MNWEYPVFISVFALALFILRVFSAGEQLDFDDGLTLKKGLKNKIVFLVLKPFAAFNSYLPLPGYRRYIEKMLAESGDFQSKFEVFLARQEAMAVFCPLMFAFATQELVPEYLLIAAAIGFFNPLITLDSNKKRRMNSLKKELPFFMDLLTLAVEAGADFAFAITRIVDALGDTPMRFELQLLITRMKSGSSRREAIENLARRVSFPDMLSLCSALIQSDETGTSLVTVLRNQSEFIHKRQIEEWREKAKKASTKMVIPLVLFIFPTMFIMILGPVALSLWETYVANFG